MDTIPVNVSCKACNSNEISISSCTTFFLYICTVDAHFAGKLSYVNVALSKNYINRYQFKFILLKIFCVDETQLKPV